MPSSWFASAVPTRLVAGGLLIATAVLAVLLVLERNGPAIVEQRIGPTRCYYDTGQASAIVEVPFSAKTRGRVSWEIQGQLLDRTQPSRQAYVTTRFVSMNTDGRMERKTVALAISVSHSDWLAGHNDCQIWVRTVRLP